MKTILIKNALISEITAVNEYDINYPFYAAPLEESIKKHGVILPLLAYKEDEKYILIDGFQRYRIAQKNRLESLPLQIIDRPENPEEIVRLRYELLNSSTEELNVLQKARVLNLVNKYIPLEKQNSWIQLLKLPKDNDILKILTWPEQAQQYLIKYSVSYNQIKPFLTFSQKDIEALFNFAAELSMRPVEFIKLSELLNECALNEGISIKEILEEESVNKILFDNEINRNQKIAQLKDIFQLRRSPVISKYRQKMDELNKQIKTNHFMIYYDKTFERSGLQLNAAIKNAEDIEKFLNALNDSENKEILIKMLKQI